MNTKSFRDLSHLNTNVKSTSKKIIDKKLLRVAENREISKPFLGYSKNKSNSDKTNSDEAYLNNKLNRTEKKFDEKINFKEKSKIQNENGKIYRFILF